jgi:hypothetical protein
MNDMPFPRRFPWLPAMAILAFSGALFLSNWLVWTPMQRYYLGAYLRCALFGTEPAVGTEVRWLYKTAPHKQQELATNADVVPATAGDGRGIPIQLSPAARQAGWTGLLQGPEEWPQTVRLQPFLEAQFYDGKSIWRLLLTPLLWGAAMFFSMLAGRSALQSWLEHRQEEFERTMWDAPPPRLLERWRAKMGRLRFRLPRFWKPRGVEIAPEPMQPGPAIAPDVPMKKPTLSVLAVFGGAPAAEPGKAFVWDESNGID